MGDSCGALALFVEIVVLSFYFVMDIGWIRGFEGHLGEV